MYSIHSKLYKANGQHNLSCIHGFLLYLKLFILFRSGLGESAEDFNEYVFNASLIAKS